MSTDHIIVANQDDGSYLLKCKICGGTYTPSLPVPTDMFVAQMEAFGNRHEKCGEEPAMIFEAGAIKVDGEFFADMIRGTVFCEEDDAHNPKNLMVKDSDSEAVYIFRGSRPFFVNPENTYITINLYTFPVN